PGGRRDLHRYLVADLRLRIEERTEVAEEERRRWRLAGRGADPRDDGRPEARDVERVDVPVHPGHPDRRPDVTHAERRGVPGPQPGRTRHRTGDPQAARAAARDPLDVREESAAGD